MRPHGSGWRNEATRVLATILEDSEFMEVLFQISSEGDEKLQDPMITRDRIAEAICQELEERFDHLLDGAESLDAALLIDPRTDVLDCQQVADAVMDYLGYEDWDDRPKARSNSAKRKAPAGKTTGKKSPARASSNSRPKASKKAGAKKPLRTATRRYRDGILL